MSVRALDHVNLRVADIKATIGFYEGVLGLKSTVPPGASDPSIATWLCDAAGRPIIHVVSASMEMPSYASGPAETGSGAVHHVALECEDEGDIRARIERAGIPARFNEVPQASLKQIFISDPNGVLIELNFRG